MTTRHHPGCKEGIKSFLALCELVIFELGPNVIFQNLLLKWLDFGMMMWHSHQQNFKINNE